MFRITRTEAPPMSTPLMVIRATLVALAGGFALGAAAQGDVVTLKATVVALAAQPELRAEFEEGLVRKARDLKYNAVPSYDLVPDVTDVDNRDFIKRMLTNGVGAVLMVRPASVGPDASLESVKEAVSPAVYANMRAFARELSPSGEEDILAVVHLAIYLISIDGAGSTSPPRAARKRSSGSRTSSWRTSTASARPFESTSACRRSSRRPLRSARRYLGVVTIAWAALLRARRHHHGESTRGILAPLFKFH
jgi:hypothetical protein